MTDKRCCWPVFLAVTAAHLVLLALLVTTPGAVEPPVSPHTIQGVLLSAQPPKSVTAPREKSVPRPAPRPAPQPVMPVKAPPSERAITLPPAESVPVTPIEAKQSPVEEHSPQPAPPQEPFVEKASHSAAGREEPLTVPRIEAGHLKNPAPKYPPASKRLGEQGQVLLDVLIRADGTVGDIRVKTSSGHTRLDTAALDAVKQWRYQPARRGTTPIAYWYVQAIIFSLKK